MYIRLQSNIIMKIRGEMCLINENYELFMIIQITNSFRMQKNILFCCMLETLKLYHIFVYLIHTLMDPNKDFLDILDHRNKRENISVFRSIESQMSG